jgi:hypothetical protein
LPQADFVAGHFALSTVRAAYPAHRLVTVIREPRVRILSHWLFWRGNDATTMPGWGTWLDRVAMARQPLLAFLTNPVLASQVDNLLVRMLVWPHPLLPIGGFIPPDSDRPLLAAAARALAACDFVGLMEEPALDDRLSRWLGAAIHRRRENETQPLPADLRPDLGRELSEPTFAALDARTRLDRVLWAGELARVCPGRDADAAAARAWVMALLRYVAAAVVQPTGDAFPATPSFSQAAA